MDTCFTTSLDSTRIAFDVSGAGTPILLLHGGGGSRADWHTGGYVARLKDEFTVIPVDLRGHGESGKPTDPASYTTEELGQDILAVADACGAESFIVCGFSFGGNVGRYLAARSKRVAQLIMLGNRMGSGVSGEFRRFVFDFRARWAPVVQAAGSAFDTDRLSERDQEDIRHLSFPGKLLPTMLALSTAMLDWGTVTPADLHCPTLWLIGSENDKAMESLKDYKGQIDGSQIQVRIIEGMNHEQEFENVEQVLPVILNFIRS
jgi:pimeloyl-ACP methyl ester carboxylesterase